MSIDPSKLKPVANAIIVKKLDHLLERFEPIMSDKGKKRVQQLRERCVECL